MDESGPGELVSLPRVQNLELQTPKAGYSRGQRHNGNPKLASSLFGSRNQNGDISLKVHMRSAKASPKSVTESL